MAGVDPVQSDLFAAELKQAYAALLAMLANSPADFVRRGFFKSAQVRVGLVAIATAPRSFPTISFPPWCGTAVDGAIGAVAAQRDPVACNTTIAER
jgi:hypothetical protein